MPTKKEYLNFIKKSCEELRGTYEKTLDEWRKQTESADTYTPPTAPLVRGMTDGFLYSVTKDEDYAKRARDALLAYAEFPKEVSDRIKQLPRYAKGIYPIVPNIRLFLRAYEFIRNSRLLKNEDRETLKQMVGNTVEAFFSFPEWGPHNRAATSGISLTYAAKMFPDHPQAPKWARLGNLLMDASWGHWSLEDSEGYCLIWLADLLMHIDIKGDSSIYDSPMLKYYFDYYTNLLCPLGMVPDFGDAQWGMSWDLCLLLLEKGATVYRDPYMKYAADQVFRQARKFGIYCILAYLWADDTVEAKVPTTGSREVLDEVIGKKIVFRSGWDENATYLLLNYMDEGDIGWSYKEHLRNTLVVTAEKMHHGHADENSIVALIKDGSFLLHDGGYREALPNGAYRADAYHNRIVVREGKPTNQTLFGFMHGKGVYQPVRTRRVHFKVFRDVDVSRTDVIDEKNGYHWDRVITYLKGLEAFVVHDGVKILRDGEFTVSNLFWTQQIHEAGANHFDTSIELIGLVGAWGHPGITVEERKQRACPNRKGRRLLIYFHPGASKTTGVDEAMRCYLPERCVYQSCSESFKTGDIVSFITILWPHKAEESTDGMLGRIESIDVDRYPRAAAIRLTQPNGNMSICVKHDLSIGLVRPNKRPVYTYDAGKIQYGELTTDAAYAYTKLSDDTLTYAFIDGMKLFFKGKEVFSSEKPSVYDLGHRGDISRRGVFETKLEYWEYELRTKWESWEDNIQL